MEKTEEILDLLSIDKRIISLFKEKVKIPFVADNYRSFSDKWYPHPPMLIPIFIDYSFPILKGIIYHPFIRRNITIVSYDLEVQYMLEKARTSDQFLTKMVLEMDMIAEGLTQEIINFCSDVEYEYAGDVDLFAEKYGDNPDFFKMLKCFDKQTPLSYCSSLEEYDGDFISSEKLFNKKLIESSCSYEISNKNWLGEVQNVPEWLKKENDLKALFEEYLNEGALDKAWLTLNSSGWKLDDIATALEKIGLKYKNQVFENITRNWISGMNSYLSK